MSHNSSSRGFTLTELMVALALTAILLAAVYNMFITSSAVFQTQEELASAQYQLETSLEQVMADLRRAGFGATPHAARDPLFCTTGGVALQGIEVIEGGGAEQIPFSETNPHIQPDILEISGNFTTSHPIPGSADAGSSTIRLHIGEAAPPRAYPPQYRMSAQEFSTVFPAGRLVAVRHNGRSQLLSVQSADYPVITVSRLSTGGCTIQGKEAPVQVSPVDLVRYSIQRVQAADPQDPRTRLVRQLVDLNGQPLARPALVVAENAVDFQIWFMFRNSDPHTNVIPPDEILADQSGNTAIVVDGSQNARPDLIRSAVVRLAVRTDLEHGEVMHRARSGDGDRLVTFDTNGQVEDGAAPVLVLTSEVEIANFSLRDLGAQ